MACRAQINYARVMAGQMSYYGSDPSCFQDRAQIMYCLIDQIEAADLPDICIGSTHAMMILVLSIIWIRISRDGVNQGYWSHRVFSWTDFPLIRWELTRPLWLRGWEEDDLTECNILPVKRGQQSVLAGDQPGPGQQAGNRLEYSLHKTMMGRDRNIHQPFHLHKGKNG